MASLPESAGEISVDGKMLDRERYSERATRNITTYICFAAGCCR